MGKGKDPNASDRSQHVSKPMSSLKDPASFGPPPKHIKYHGPAALPNETTPDRRGLGAPVPQPVQPQFDHQDVQQPEEPARPTPPVPYRADRTGLSTSNLPPPPRRTDPPAAPTQTTPSKPKPSVPPRIPPRQPSPPPAYSPQPAAGHGSDGYINQQSTSNLSRAGVSVPELGIDSNANTGSTGSTGSSRVPPPPPSRGPDRQPSFPSSRTDSPSTPSSLSSLRDRHGDKIDVGKQKISGINEKYGISRRINNFIEDQKSPADQGPPPPPHPNRTGSNTDMQSMSRRKAPPPPPPKRTEMRAPPVGGTGDAPPLPLDTKPR